jgi:hypothetical protein
VALLFGPAVRAAEPAVSAEDLRPGLVTTYRDGAGKKAVELVLLEPTIALSLKPGEAPHPRLKPDGGTVRWQGYLNVLRPASYRFSAVLRGKFLLTIGGKKMLAAQVKAAQPQRKFGPAIRLEAGVLPLEAEFTRFPGTARLELFWQAPYFHTEPLPYKFVGHLPRKVPAGLKTSLAQERGRFVAEEHNCTACHRPAETDRLAKGLHVRQGPDLSQVGNRVSPGWLYRWLKVPQTIRPGTPMPEMFTNDEAGRTERYAVARYLASLGGPFSAKGRGLLPKELARRVASGKRQFTSLGCIACHQ